MYYTCISAEELINKYNQGERDFTGVGLISDYLTDVSLEGIILTRSNLGRVKFERVNLKNANFNQADLHFSQMNDVDLSGARLNQADLVPTLSSLVNNVPKSLIDTFTPLANTIDASLPNEQN